MRRSLSNGVVQGIGCTLGRVKSGYGRGSPRGTALGSGADVPMRNGLDGPRRVSKVQLGSCPIMPIYIYSCTKCEQDSEYLQKISDSPKTTCEQCGGSLRKKVTAAAFHLKGGGWYKDLYSSSKPDAVKSGDGEQKNASTNEGKKTGGNESTATPSDSNSSSTPTKKDTPKPTKPAKAKEKSKEKSKG